jgi:hypothetical protein
MIAAGGYNGGRVIGVGLLRWETEREGLLKQIDGIGEALCKKLSAAK